MRKAGRKGASHKAAGKAGTSKAAAAERRRLYIEAFCTNGGNKTQAAVSAGFKPGWAAEKAGQRLSNDVRVSEVIAKRQAEKFAHAAERTLVTAEEIMLDLSDAARFDPIGLFEVDGKTFKSMADIPADLRRQMEGIEFQEITVRGKVIGRIGKVKFPKKTAVREQAMKHFGLFKADNLQKQASPLAALPIDLQQRIYDRLVERGFITAGPADRGSAAAGGVVRSLPGPAPVAAV